MDVLIDNEIINADRLTMHLLETAERAAFYADKFDNGKYGYFCGIVHEAGRFTEEYANSLSEGYEYPIYAEGAVISSRMGHGGKLMSYCIAGLENGLMDYGGNQRFDDGTLSAYFGKSNGNCVLPDEIEEKIKLPIMPVVLPIGGGGFSYSFFVRMMFSCLIEAESAGSLSCRRPDYGVLLNRIEALTAEYPYREQVLAAIKGGSCDSGILSVLIPKNECLIPFAMAASNAAQNDCERIIYVVSERGYPEKTAAALAEITGGAEYFTAHIDADTDFCHDFSQPVIVTTHEHFFTSCLSAEKSCCKKLHNLSRSVIVFEDLWQHDSGKLIPYISIITELVRNYGSSVILANTAQKAWQKVFPEIEQVENKKLPALPKKKYCLKSDCFEAAVESADKSVLVLYDDISAALDLYQGCENAYFLSEFMCPAHRQKVFEQIKSSPHSKKVIFARRAFCEFMNVICLDNDADLFLEAESACADGGIITLCSGNIADFSDEAIKARLDKRYADKQALDAHEISRRLSECGFLAESAADSFNFPFRTISERASVEAAAVVVKLDEADLGAAKSDGELQKYAVNIPLDYFSRLVRSGSVMPLSEKSGILTDLSLYSHKTGLIPPTKEH